MITLRRVTSSETYLPFMDGIRFFLVFSVVLGHFVDFYEVHTWPVRQEKFYQNLHLDSAFGLPDNCILVFFVISGFILGLPFARSLLSNSAYPDLKKFYLRRITRLGPPYLLVLTGLFFLNVFVIHRDTFQNTFPHFLASFFYLHNIIFESYPTLNFVFWTLEIEMQFYLIAPLFACVFKIEKIKRRVLLVALVFFLGWLNTWYKPPFISIYNYAHYFLAGFLALDLFLHNTLKKSYVFDVICISLVLLIYTGVFKYGIASTFMMVFLIYLSPLSVLWEKLLTAKWITVTGGMCYSIYMLHQPLMAVFLNRFMGNEMIVNSVWGDFVLRLIVVLLLVTGVSTLFFVLVERPCMKKDWYNHLRSQRWIRLRR